jgi:hypothetical protein
MKKQNYISICTSHRTHTRITPTLSDTQLFLLPHHVIERNQRCNWQLRCDSIKGATHMNGVTHMKGVTHTKGVTQ